VSIINEQKAALISPDVLCEKIKTIIDDHKGQQVVIVDLKEKSSIADYMIIVSGTSNRHLVGIAHSIAGELAKEGVRPKSMEGLSLADWVLIDLGDVIVHLFRPEVRSFYDLEKMWGVVLPPSQEEISL
jgi:ribosome-associated protein